MLIGSAVHALDAKGRVVIPAKYRDDLGSVIFAFPSIDGCIRLYSYEQFQRVLGKLHESDVTKLALRRKISGSAEQLSIDGQGRILLPELLRKKAGINEKVRMVGMIDWLEMWSEDTYEDDDSMTYEEELQAMAALGMS
jgi:Uncharacterized protein conserved in bacteria